MRFSFIVILVGFFFYSCNKKNKYETIAVFGHAGNGLEISSSIYHDNSAESIELALAQNGCDGVEVDVQLSLDGTLWLYHDEKLDTESTGTGCIPESKDEQLRSLTYSTFQKEKLIRLEEVILNGKSIFLDLRHFNFCSEKVVDLNLFISKLKKFKEQNPKSAINFITNNEVWISPLINANFSVFYGLEDPIELNKYLSSYPKVNFIFKNKIADNYIVSTIKNKGLKVAIFEVRSPKAIKAAFSKSPDYIISDDLKATLIEKY